MQTQTKLQELFSVHKPINRSEYFIGFLTIFISGVLLEVILNAGVVSEIVFGLCISYMFSTWYTKRFSDIFRNVNIYKAQVFLFILFFILSTTKYLSESGVIKHIWIDVTYFVLSISNLIFCIYLMFKRGESSLVKPDQHLLVKEKSSKRLIYIIICVALLDMIINILTHNYVDKGDLPTNIGSIMGSTFGYMAGSLLGGIVFYSLPKFLYCKYISKIKNAESDIIKNTLVATSIFSIIILLTRL